jgi:hypothetical protein
MSDDNVAYMAPPKDNIVSFSRNHVPAKTKVFAHMQYFC